MVKITIIGNHTNISDSHIIIPAGVHIGRGITVVFIHRIGIHGIGVQRFIWVIPIIRIIGVIGIPILCMTDTGMIILPDSL